MSLWTHSELQAGRGPISPISAQTSPGTGTEPPHTASIKVQSLIQESVIVFRAKYIKYPSGSLARQRDLLNDAKATEYRLDGSSGTDSSLHACSNSDLPVPQTTVTNIGMKFGQDQLRTRYRHRRPTQKYSLHIPHRYQSKKGAKKKGIVPSHCAQNTIKKKAHLISSSKIPKLRYDRGIKYD